MFIVGAMEQTETAALIKKGHAGSVVLTGEIVLLCSSIDNDVPRCRGDKHRPTVNH